MHWPLVYVIYVRTNAIEDGHNPLNGWLLLQQVRFAILKSYTPFLPFIKIKLIWIRGWKRAAINLVGNSGHAVITRCVHYSIILLGFMQLGEGTINLTLLKGQEDNYRGWMGWHNLPLCIRQGTEAPGSQCHCRGHFVFYSQWRRPTMSRLSPPNIYRQSSRGSFAGKVII